MLISTWTGIRILGLLAYFYFTIAVIFGLLRKSSYVKSKKNLIYHIHQSASWIGFIALIGHMILLLIDKYQPYSLTELVIPFASDYKTGLSSLGTIGFYLFLMVMFTSDLLMTKMNRKVWKVLHIMVLPAWLLSLAHGIFIGTDSANPYIQLFYFITAGIAFIIMILRVATKDDKKKATTRRTVTTKPHETPAS